MTTTKKESKEFHRFLDFILDDVFQVANQMNLNDAALAAASGLSYSCVRNIEQRTTRYPRLQTVYLLAKAVGLQITISALAKVRKLA